MIRSRSRRFGRLEMLEDRIAPAIFEFPDPHPAAGNQFGATVVPLSTGNVVVTAPMDSFAGTQTGAVYLFNGATGALISTLRGSTAFDRIGNAGVVALTNGNFVVRSPNWANSGLSFAGAVTWGSGTTGINGTVGIGNSLVGGTTNDQVGSASGVNSVIALTNGNYVVRTATWDNGPAFDAGATTWGSGTTGVSGVVSSANSLVGATAQDSALTSGVIALTNGNYVVNNPFWNNGGLGDVGAVTWGNGTTGISGLISAANSLIGQTSGEEVGLNGVTALTNGNYVVCTANWGGHGGAATYCNGGTGLVGVISASNSLVGTGPGAADNIGSGGAVALTNGNYVVISPLVGNAAGAFAGSGAVSLCNGTTGTVGHYSMAVNLVGGANNDQVGSGGAFALTNGNYVVCSPIWHNGGAVGAATFVNGTTGLAGSVSTSNSLYGGVGSDSIGSFGVAALSNGNYVVKSPAWHNVAVNNAGAATWGNGTTGTSGLISSANSLVGSTANDLVGSRVTPLTNGNYVASSPNWNNGSAGLAGVATWGNGTTGTSGVVSSLNSLVGSKTNDNVGNVVTALANGNYVVASSSWDNGAIVDAGAATWGNGTMGVAGPITLSNSLVGTVTSDFVSSSGILALANGNYAVATPNWDTGSFGNAGAITFATGATGVTGSIANANCLAGLANGTGVSSSVADNVNGTILGRFVTEGGGRVRIGSQATGFVPPCVSKVVINNGDAQRSRVTTLSVEFDQRVQFTVATSSVFQLIRQSDSAPVSFSTTTDSTGPGTTVTFTFTAGPLDGDSLADGRYTLSINALQVNNGFYKLDGDCNGTGGDNFVTPTTGAGSIHRLFGDADGNGSITASDFNAFRLVYGSGPSIFDFDNDGQTSAADFNQFRLRYGMTLAP